MKRVKSKHPLRRIVGTEHVHVYTDKDGAEHTTPHDLLECGHTLAPAKDIFGRLFPTRRRCWRCAGVASKRARSITNQPRPG